MQRVHIVVRGAVQGVGFRPFVFRLASELGIRGWVVNSQLGVVIDVEAAKEILDTFLLRLDREKPPRAFIQGLESSFLDPVGYSTFEIRQSDLAGTPAAFVLPDIATCPECCAELFDPANRRFRYPFINCTNCGPRYTIIEALPYDRPKTTMRVFAMCARCATEYANPHDRRFHAQPNACPVCGPSLELWDERGSVLGREETALQGAATLIREGRIIAMKGIGGFLLLADARNDQAVRRLRDRKHREEKPFALLYPSLEAVREDCHVDQLEVRLLRSAESPIVLLRRRRAGGIAPSVAPSNPFLGVMLPYAPLHHLLLHDLGFPVVATSGNISDEPICIDEFEALHRLHMITDAFLVHNRPIVRHCDDSIARVVLGREMLLRRARGYAPLPVTIPLAVPDLLAVGAHLKNTIAVARGRNVFISQHLGDLETEESLRAFHHEIDQLQHLYEIQPRQVVSDQHPDYLSSAYARHSGIPNETCQHHYAHVTSCMAENDLDGTVLGVAWDGTGYGTDGTVWGGEFLLTDATTFQRAGRVRRFRLPGGEAAVREPRRSALGVLFEIYGERIHQDAGLARFRTFTEAEQRILLTMLERGVNAPLTSSVGRLFDAVASLTGLRQLCTYEGQAAMELEFAVRNGATAGAYEIGITRPSGAVEPAELDWMPMITALLQDIAKGIDTGTIAARFHNGLVAGIVHLARRTGVERVVLTGGCFQNRYLTETTVQELEAAGFRPYWHQRVPPNDGGIALGQVYAFARAHRGAGGSTAPTAADR